MSSRLNDVSTNDVAKNLYSEYQNEICIADNNYMGTAHYNPFTSAIKLNTSADAENCTGPGSTYFHEVGHFLDDRAGNGHAWLSSEPAFRSALEKDVDKYIDNTMLIFGCSQEEAYDIVSGQLEGDSLAGVSDIFGSLTGCRCQGDWGHSVNYWLRDTSNVEKEAFANMFEASIGSEDKIVQMKRFFPTAYATFENIIRQR